MYNTPPHKKRSDTTKIPKISPGAYIFQRRFLRGLFLEGLIYEGNLRINIDWASLIVGRKFTVFTLFYSVCEGDFPSTSPWGGGGGLYLEERFNGGFLCYQFGGLIFGGGYFPNFTVFAISLAFKDCFKSFLFCFLFKINCF